MVPVQETPVTDARDVSAPQNRAVSAEKSRPGKAARVTD